MAKACFAVLAALAMVLALSLPAAAQESAVKGNIDGVVVDASGASVPSAKITLNGPEGTKATTTDEQGNFFFPLVIPGMYSVRVEKQGFKSVSVSGIEVLTNKVSSVRATLEAGAITETVEVTGSAITVDTTTTAIGANLNDTFYEKIPIPRGVAGLFYLAPGVANGGASGKSNPSISGGSGLENQYVADGVDITDSAFGGLGIFSRTYGSLGTGINLTFIKEVEVKTGGYEPQYGKSTGGIVQIVTKSGGNSYHGAISAYFQPQQFEATRTNPDDPQFGVVNLTGKLVHDESYDAAAELGGYVPKFKDHLFFYAAINPTLNDQFAQYPINSPLYSNGTQTLRTYTYSYDGKLTWKINDKNQIESSVFGDPSHTSDSPWVRLTTHNTTADSKLSFGNRDWDVRYNGTLSPTWLVNISGAWGYNHFDETGFPAVHEIIDQTEDPFGGSQFTAQGRGFVEPTQDNTFKINLDTTKTVHFWGEQAFSFGVGWEKSFYKGGRQYSGGTDPVPAANMDGTALALNPGVAGAAANSEWYLRTDPACTACPLMNVPGQGLQPVYLYLLRSEFDVDPSTGIKSFTTNSVYKSAFINDSWSLSKYVTLSVGGRWDENHMVGQATKYTFVDNWSPRLGLSIDPWGDRKSKIFANFARYNYNLPLDLAERSLTNELDLFSFRLAPDYTTVGGQKIVNINPATGTVNVKFDSAHVLNGVNGGEGSLNIGSSVQSTEAIEAGTRDMYEDEWVAGYEHQFSHGVVFTAKYVRRDLKRLVEDTGGVSPEAADLGYQQVFVIGNINAKTDFFTNPVPSDFTPNGTGATPTAILASTTNFPTGCSAANSMFPVLNSVGVGVTDSNGNTAVCFNPAKNANAGKNVPDGIPDGFVNPVRRYTAVEFEVNKSFSHNWQMRANYRIARLFGNYEGALRNDNGQTDPGISSLFDFTTGNFGLLGDQFLPGVLPTDRLHIVNGFFTYVFDHGALKSLALGTGIRVQTGTPISELAAHPVYLNAGEVPIGGRGVEGRTPTTGTVDFHSEYPIKITEWGRLHIGADLFNIGFAKRALFINQNIDLGFGTPNADFLKPNNQTTVLNNDAFQSPFVARLFVKFEF
jgi:Carboxypeptidase regulatory-like domain/TonB-dependent Receptor Plug Domain